MGRAKSQSLTVCQNCRTTPKIHPSIFIAPKIHHFYCTHSKIHIPFFLVFIAHTQKSIFHVFWLLHAMSSPQRPPFPCLSPLGRTCASPCRRLSASSTAVYCTVQYEPICPSMMQPRPAKHFGLQWSLFPGFRGFWCVCRGREGALDDGGGQVTRQKCSTRRVLSRRPGALE